jgi:hypothetical protein
MKMEGVSFKCSSMFIQGFVYAFITSYSCLTSLQVFSDLERSVCRMVNRQVNFLHVLFSICMFPPAICGQMTFKWIRLTVKKYYWNSCLHFCDIDAILIIYRLRRLHGLKQILSVAVIP